MIDGISLGVGPDRIDGNYKTMQVGVYRASDEEGAEPIYTMDVNVYPSTLITLSVNCELNYMAFDSVDVTSVTAVFSGGGSRILDPREYEIVYLDEDGNRTDRTDFRYGDYQVLFEYQENGVPMSIPVDVFIDYATVDVPYRSSGTDSNYDGEPNTWIVSGFTQGLIGYEETGTDKGLTVRDNNDGTLSINATDVGDYQLTFKIANPNYEWSTGGRDSITLDFHIRVHSSSITVNYPSGLVYTGQACDPTVVVIGIGDQEIDFSDDEITYVYYGINANGVSVGSASNPRSGIPVDAGSWFVRATYSGSGNYDSSSTGFQPLTISRATLTTPTVDPKEYILDTTQNSGLTGGDNWEVVSGTDIGGMNVNTYNVTVEVTDTNNYMWSNGQSIIIVYWNIIQRSIERPTANSIVYTYNGSEQEYVPIYAEDTQQYLDISGHQQTNAGDNYVATISLYDQVNCRWADGQSNDTTISWSIQRQGIPVPTVNSGTYEYTGNDVTAGMTNYYYDRMTFGLSDGLSFSASEGTLSATNAGTYTIQFTPTSNYQWNDGLENPTGQRSVSWTIAVADNTISGHSRRGQHDLRPLHRGLDIWPCCEFT